MCKELRTNEMAPDEVFVGGAEAGGGRPTICFKLPESLSEPATTAPGTKIRGMWQASFLLSLALFFLCSRLAAYLGDFLPRRSPALAWGWRDVLLNLCGMLVARRH